MRVVHLARRAFPQTGGVETHLDNLITAGRSKNEHWIVITRQACEDESLHEKVSWGEVYRIPLKATGKIATWQWILKHKQLFYQADIVQVHDIFWWILPLYLSVSQKVCTTFHGWEGIYPVPKKNILQRRLYSLLSKKVIHIGAWINEFYGDKANLVLYGGCNFQEESISIKRKRKNTHQLTLAFYGRLEPENDIEKYIELVKLLRETMTVEMTWVGDGSLRECAIKVGEVTGMVHDPSKYFNSADFVCTNSYLSMFQVAASGNIPICLYSHELKKRYLETFPLVDQCIIGCSVSDVCDRVLELFTDQTSFVKKQARIAAHASEFTWESVGRQYRGLWKAVIHKPKLLHSAHTLGMGGAESFNTALLSELFKNSCDIWGVSNFHPYLLRLAENGVPTIKQPFVVDIIGDWKGVVKAVATIPVTIAWYILLHIRFPNLSTIVLSGFPEKILWSPVARLFGVRVIWIEFAPLTTLQHKHFGMPLFLYRLASRCMDTCVVPTQYTFDTFKRDAILQVEKISIIPCGSALSPVKAPQKKAENKILCISRFEAGKGQEILLEAFFHLKKLLPQSHLTLIGTGDTLQEMKTQAKRLGISDSVTFTGWVPSVVPFLDEAQVLVFPSYWSLEGFGMTQIEAFARGVPVVAANCGPATSIIQHNSNGLLVEPQNPQALAAALERLSKDQRLRTKLARRALTDYTNTYSIKAVAQNYSQLLCCRKL